MAYAKNIPSLTFYDAATYRADDAFTSVLDIVSIRVLNYGFISA